MKKLLMSILIIACLAFSIGGFAQNKVVVVPLGSSVNASANIREIVTDYVVIGPSSTVEIQVPAESTLILTDLIGTNHLNVTVQVNDEMKLDLTTYFEKQVSMVSGIACPAGSTVKITNTTGTVTAVTVAGYYY